MPQVLPVIVLVCGDRNWTDADAIRVRLGLLPRDTIIIHGDNGDEEHKKGADRVAHRVAVELGFSTPLRRPADWDRYKLSAGPIRNRQMLDEVQAHVERGHQGLVLAFHKNIARSKGTKDTVEEAKRRGLTTEVVAGMTDMVPF